MPFAAWSNPDLTLTPWRLAVLSICILVLRRLPGIFCLQYFIPDVKTRREAIFVGHCGWFFRSCSDLADGCGLRSWSDGCWCDLYRPFYLARIYSRTDVSSAVHVGRQKAPYS